MLPLLAEKEKQKRKASAEHPVRRRLGHRGPSSCGCVRVFSRISTHQVWCCYRKSDDPAVTDTHAGAHIGRSQYQPRSVQVRSLRSLLPISRSSPSRAHPSSLPSACLLPPRRPLRAGTWQAGRSTHIKRIATGMHHRTAPPPAPASTPFAAPSLAVVPLTC
jgi:hypothetical protein